MRLSDVEWRFILTFPLVPEVDHQVVYGLRGHFIVLKWIRWVFTRDFRKDRFEIENATP